MATAAERVRRYRDRKRRGAEVVSIEVDGLLIEALKCEEYLCACTDKAALARAVQTQLSDWSQGVAEEYEAAEARGET